MWWIELKHVLFTSLLMWLRVIIVAVLYLLMIVGTVRFVSYLIWG